MTMGKFTVVHSASSIRQTHPVPVPIGRVVVPKRSLLPQAAYL
jgi:sensor histidine kinase regulating citrate/malate metabolism